MNKFTIKYLYDFEIDESDKTSFILDKINFKIIDYDIINTNTSQLDVKIVLSCLYKFNKTKFRVYLYNSYSVEEFKRLTKNSSSFNSKFNVSKSSDGEKFMELLKKDDSNKLTFCVKPKEL